MSILFEPFILKNVEIRNRFVRSATYDGFADNSYVSEAQIKLFSDLAEGGVGLIIAGIAYVHHTGQVSPFQNSIAGDEFISGFKQLTDAVHKRRTGDGSLSQFTCTSKSKTYTKNRVSNMVMMMFAFGEN